MPNLQRSRGALASPLATTRPGVARLVTDGALPKVEVLAGQRLPVGWQRTVPLRQDEPFDSAPVCCATRSTRRGDRDR